MTKIKIVEEPVNRDPAIAELVSALLVMQKYNEDFPPIIHHDKWLDIYDWVHYAWMSTSETYLDDIRQACIDVIIYDETFDILTFKRPPKLTKQQWINLGKTLTTVFKY